MSLSWRISHAAAAIHFPSYKSQEETREDKATAWSVLNSFDLNARQQNTAFTWRTERLQAILLYHHTGDTRVLPIAPVPVPPLSNIPGGEAARQQLPVASSGCAQTGYGGYLNNRRQLGYKLHSPTCLQEWAPVSSLMHTNCHNYWIENSTNTIQKRLM